MIGIVAILIVIGSGLVGLYLFRDPYSENQIRELINRSYSHQRPGGGRLFAASYNSLDDSPVAKPDLGKAQILLLRQTDSPERQRLQGLIYLAAGEWQNFVELSSDLVEGQDPVEPAVLNNLGASFLALSDKDPTLLLKALDAFEQASKLDPGVPEPLFNLVVTYRKLRFSKLADEALRRYATLDPASAWQKEIANPPQKDEASVVEQLETFIKTNNLVQAERLFQSNPELCRRVAMQYALSNEDQWDAVMQFIGNQTEKHYGDKTISAMLAPLFTERRDMTIALRRLVSQGAELYVNGKYSESLAAYTEAAALARKTDSVFDRLWVDLNRVDTEIRLGKFEAVRTTLSRMVTVADEERFLWLKAKELSVYGFTLKLTSSYLEMLSLLTTANEEFVHLDAPHDRIRVLYYLAAYRHYGGDQEEALRLALDCIRLVDDGDAGRISTFDWLIGTILYRRGLLEKSMLFVKESVEQSHKARYAGGVEVQASITMADLYQSVSKYNLAWDYLRMAEDAVEKGPEGYDRIRSELLLGIMKAKVKINQHEYGEAESLLERSLDLYAKQPFSATPLLSPSLMLLAEVYSETGRIDQAGRKFNQAIDVIEKDDDYMKSERFRVKFDDERRELYDAAIDFEFRNGSLDAAWTYLQKYRAKLFLEFLAAFNPGIKLTQARLDRLGIQQRVPKDTQIAEYLLLKDRLLIWVIADRVFTLRSVPVSRTDLETKVQTVLQKLRIGGDVDNSLADLSKLLIDPIRDLLDPHRSLTIIPDRALHGLPFDALKQSGRAHYLIEDFPIVISPSLTHFLTSKGALPPRDEVVGFSSQNGGSSEFKELAALSEFYPKAATFTGHQVSKASFLTSLEKAAVFHYAGHSAKDAADPLRSAILLDGDRSGPNSVTAIDISQQRLPNNAVVILSSCDSSVGNSRDGIGVRGLTSAFLIGGAGSVVGSLWPVEASSTADLMVRFHRAFAKSGMPVAKALREAQLAFLKAFPERSHPYYWSGFVVTGNFSALR